MFPPERPSHPKAKFKPHHQEPPCPPVSVARSPSMNIRRLIPCLRHSLLRGVVGSPATGKCLRLLAFCALVVLTSAWSFTLSAQPSQAISLPAQQNPARPSPFPEGRFSLEAGDVVAFLGGADVATAQLQGHLETLLTLQFFQANPRFRNFGWEGDTVFSQPRDIGFPELIVHLQKAQATVVVLQFGRMESLQGPEDLAAFETAYASLLDRCGAQTPRLVLVTPLPFEKAPPPLPDLSARNGHLSSYVDSIRALARARQLPLVDLFAQLQTPSGPAAGISNTRTTTDGLQLTAQGHARVAEAFARQLNLNSIVQRSGGTDSSGAFINPHFEAVRQIVIIKNRLWFDYWRPQNWAFLGGDRTNQPSSRDHLNPQIRWFPQEIELFKPLIESKEREIAGRIQQLLPGKEDQLKK